MFLCYSYDATGHLIVAGVPDNFDANGNMLIDGNKTNTYNGFNQLVSTTVDAKTLEYKYNADGLRTEKTVDGVTTTYVLDSDQVVMELNSDYTVAKRYLRGFNLISSDTGKSTLKTYYNYNAHGDVTQLVNAAGTVTRNYKYDSFGNEIDKEPTDTNVFRYSGEAVDLETGYIYLRARYYDPVTSRILFEDSFTR